MINFNNWKIFDKRGNNLNLFTNAFIPLVTTSLLGINATGYYITDPSGIVSDSVITNSGYGFDGSETNVLYLNLLSTNTWQSADVSINFIDVSIFNPSPTNSKGVGSFTINDNFQSTYPSVTYAGTLFLKPISVGLVETECLYILEEYNNSHIRPYDINNTTLKFKFEGDDNEISFFTVDENENTISWTDELLITDTSVLVYNTALPINIGFKADNEGVYERRLRIYHVVNNAVNINKYELLCLINQVYDLGKTIVRTSGPKNVNKILVC